MTTAKEKIKRYLTEQDVDLSAEDVAIMKRWEFVDKKMAQGITVTSILRQLIMDEFSVSVHTADNDIFSAQEVFGESRRINKKYLSHLHLQELHDDLTKIRQSLFSKQKDEDTGIEYEVGPSDKMITALAKLHDAYTYQLNSIPDNTAPPIVKRPVWIFVSPNRKPIDAPMQLNDALKIADKILSIEPVKKQPDA